MDLNSMNGSEDMGDLKGSSGGGTQSLHMFDFISPKMEMEAPMLSSSSLTLTPIELIDPSDYTIDDNNNNFVTVTPMKSILDEMIQLESGSGDHSSNGGSLELLGTFHWGDATNSSNSSSSVSLSLMSPSGVHGSWHTQGHLLHPPSSEETEVTTLTTLLADPLFVSFDNNILMKSHEHGDLHGSSTSPSVISSDLISTTYREKSLSTVWPAKEDLSHDQVPPSPTMCDDSLLRSALQAVPFKKQEGPLQGMSELRRVLAHPPLPPVSTDLQEDSGTFCYDNFKILTSGTIDDDSFLPNVEELIMTRNDPSFSSAALNRLSTSNTSTKSSTANALSAKWTYTTPSSNNSSEGTKRKRSKLKEIKKISLSESSKDNSSSSPGSPAGGGDNSSGSSSARKERSLHYCTVCSKGFKDKYSVNVHVRTHTGEKPFACITCGKSFRQKAHLAKHYQTHAAKLNSNTSNSKKSNVQSSKSPATPTFS